MYPFQLVAQVALITNGESSFAIFLYDKPAIVQELTDAAWFSSEEGRRRTDVLYSLGYVNVFRTDGMAFRVGRLPMRSTFYGFLGCIGLIPVGLYCLKNKL